MAEVKSGKFVLWVVIYYFFLFIIVFASNNTFSFYGVNSVNYTGADFQNKINPFETDGICTTPRVINTDTTNRVIYSDGDCKYISNGLPSNTTCNRVEGCNWSNTSTYLWFFTKDVPEYCKGDINVTFYNNGTDLSFLSPSRVCGLTALQNDSELCNLFSCTYIKYDNIGGSAINLGDKVSFSSVWDSVKFITGFNIDMDMPKAFQWLFSGIFFWLPLIALLVGIYFSLPFI